MFEYASNNSVLIRLLFVLYNIRKNRALVFLKHMAGSPANKLQMFGTTENMHIFSVWERFNFLM
jgi:hypothetical protein